MIVHSHLVITELFLCWPIRGGETFGITFSVHDIGDAIYTSTVLLDHFKFHSDLAVGMIDPLN